MGLTLCPVAKTDIEIRLLKFWYDCRDHRPKKQMGPHLPFKKRDSPIYSYMQCQHTVMGTKGTSAETLSRFPTSYSYMFLCLSITVVWVKCLSGQHATEIKYDTTLSY